MNQLIANPAPTNRLGTPSTIPTLTVFYETEAAGTRAKALMDCVCSPFAPEEELKLEFWSFKALRDPMIEAQAVRAAAGSYLMVLSLESPRLLPVEVVAMVTRWLQSERPGPTALVVLMVQHSAAAFDQEMLVSGLRRLAEQHGTDFFCEFVERKAASPGPLAIPSSAMGSETLFAGGSKDSGRPDRWGINE